MSKHDDWLRAAGDACSYRRMHALAREISIETIDPQLKFAADEVADVLKDVIGLALASSDILQQARRRFTVLTTVLADTPAMEHIVTCPSSTAKQVEELLCQILEKVANRTAEELPAIRTTKSATKRTKRMFHRRW